MAWQDLGWMGTAPCGEGGGMGIGVETVGRVEMGVAWNGRGDRAPTVSRFLLSTLQ